MRVIFATLLSIGVLGFPLCASNTVPVQIYLLPSTLKPGWVVIEYDNSKCRPLKESETGREHVVPETGYLCTSSHSEAGLTDHKYYLVDSSGKRTRLTTGEQIFKPMTVYLDPFDEGCKVRAQVFWYGPQNQIDSDDGTALLKKFHPECAKAVETPIK